MVGEGGGRGRGDHITSRSLTADSARPRFPEAFPLPHAALAREVNRFEGGIFVPHLPTHAVPLLILGKL